MLNNATQPLAHVGVLEVDGSEGALVCVYQPRNLRATPPATISGAPPLAFGTPKKGLSLTIITIISIIIIIIIIVIMIVAC
jgi:hypothetical protein